MPPELRRYYTLVKETLDIEMMEHALKLLEGEHDFLAFRSSGGMNLSTVRTIYRTALIKEEEGYRIEVTGNGFLYNMVRIIAGTLFEIGKGKLDLGCITQALETGRRQLLGPTAPGTGLMLMSVEYTEEAK